MAEQDLSRIRIAKKGPIRRKRKQRAFFMILAAILVMVGILLHEKGMLQRATEVQVAPVQEVYPSQTLTLLNASGYVVAQRKAAVASKTTGRLVDLHVEEGTSVKKGEVIARLDNEDLRAARARADANVHFARSRLVQARAELTDATLEYTRNKELASKGFVARALLDTSEARFRKAQAEVAAQEAFLRASEAALSEAEVLLDYSFIRAPFDAVVLTKNADIGDIVTPLGAAANAKAAVVTIADMDSLMVEVDVTESSIEQVRTGAPCEIRLDALPDARFPGVVHMVVPTADRTKASVMVKVAFRAKSPQVLPEMSAKVAFLSRELRADEQKPFRAVPASALFRRDGREAVLVVRDGQAEERPVRVGRRFEILVEVLDGLQTGERVIVSNPASVRHGERVKVPEK